MPRAEEAEGAGVLDVTLEAPLLAAPAAPAPAPVSAPASTSRGLIPPEMMAEAQQAYATATVGCVQVTGPLVAYCKAGPCRPDHPLLHPVPLFALFLIVFGAIMLMVKGPHG